LVLCREIWHGGSMETLDEKTKLILMGEPCGSKSLKVPHRETIERRARPEDYL